MVWWSAACLSHCNFLNPGKIITSEMYAQQTDEMHRKLQHLQPVLANRKGPVLLHDKYPTTGHTTNASKVEGGPSPVVQWLRIYLAMQRMRFNPWSGN